MLVRGRNKNPNIRFEYTLASHNMKPFKYNWNLGDWSACTATCGGGTQQRPTICIDENKSIVEDELCWADNDSDRLKELTRVCNDDPCPAHWWVGPWQLCPVTCRELGNYICIEFSRCIS